MLATLDGNQPRVRPVTATWHDGFTVYFASLKRFHKTGEMTAAPQVELCYLDKDDDQVRITGIAEPVTDSATQEEAFHRDALLRRQSGQSGVHPVAREANPGEIHARVGARVSRGAAIRVTVLVRSTNRG